MTKEQLELCARSAAGTAQVCVACGLWKTAAEMVDLAMEYWRKAHHED